MTMIYSETDEFSRDLKRLSKKFASLREDLEIAKQYDIGLFHEQKIDRRGIFRLEHVDNDENIQFYKIKKFACKSLKGRGVQSGIRVIYAWYPVSQLVEFVELYFKGEKASEDRGRIVEYLKNKNRIY